MGSTWRDLVAESAGAGLNPPAAAEQLQVFTTDFGRAGRAGLRALLAETDGVRTADGTEVVWTAARITDTAASEEAAELLFFGDNGKGDRFALLGSSDRSDVWLWDGTTGGRSWVSPGLWPFLRRMLRGGDDAWYRGDLESQFH